MAQTNFPGFGLVAPPLNYVSSTPAFTSLLIDATGEKVGFVGRVWNKDHATKTIDKVHFLFGTVTKAGGSGLTVSLQDVSTASAPGQPDETQDQFRAIANGDASFATDTWYSTGLITSNGTDGGTKRTVAYGEDLAVVIEYDGSGRLSSDAVNVKMVSSTGFYNCLAAPVLKTGGSWAVQSCIPNVILEFSDGTFGTLFSAWPASAISTVAYKQNTAGADEYALQFDVQVPCKVDGCWFVASLASGAADFDVVLYSGTSALTNGTASVDATTVASNSARMYWVQFPAPQALTPGTTYYLSIKPTQNTANVTVYYFDVSAAGHWQAHAGGSTWQMAARLDLGSWDSSGSGAYAKRRPFFGLSFCSFDDGAQLGGGLPILGGSVVR